MGYSKQSQRTLDALLELKDAGLIAADDNAQVGGSDQILDMGTGVFVGEVLHEVSAIEIASGDEVYKLIVQGSSSATFASDIVDLSTVVLGDASTIATTRDVDSTTGRYISGVSNVLNDVAYRYVRLRIEVAGTIATGINVASHLVAC